MANKKLTKTQLAAIEIACRDGAVCAGASVHNGRVERVSASTILSLIDRGLLVRCCACVGGVTGKLHETSIAAATLAEKDNMSNTAKSCYLIRLVTTTGRADGLTEADMVARGYEVTGYNANTRQRAELQGAPKFRGLLGPMWDGDCLRYEDAKTYAELSS